MPSSIPSPVSAQLAGLLDRSPDVYQRLLKNRIVFLGTEVDDTNANLICAQLLLLAAEDTSRDISLYINSPGGSVTAGLAIYDTMQYVPCDVSTVCMGLAASMGQFLLCAGAKGKRRENLFPHRPVHRADRGRFRPRPVVYRSRGQGIRLHRPGYRAGSGRHRAGHLTAAGSRSPRFTGDRSGQSCPGTISRMACQPVSAE
jgi:hypothetical protein